MPTNPFQWAEWKRAHPEAFASAPSGWQAYFDQLMCREHRDGAAADAVRTLLKEIEEGGLMRALVHNIDKNDREKDRDEWEYPNLLPIVGAEPDYFTILKDFLSAETDAYWRGLATKWLAIYSPDSSAAIAALTPLLNDAADESRWWAAIQLSQKAPPTPKLIAVLIEALSVRNWAGYRRRSFVFGCTGRGEAAKALAQLGPSAFPAIRTLRDVVQFERRSVSYYDAAAACMALEALTGEPGDARERLIQIAWCCLWRYPRSNYEGDLQDWLAREADRTIDVLVHWLGWSRKLWDSSDPSIQAAIEECVSTLPPS